MYHPFFQFVLPRLGQAALDILLYLNFLQLPPLQLAAQWPVLYYGLPLVLMALLAYISRDPLGLGIVFVGHLVTFYCIGTGIGLVLRRIGGTPLTVWHIFWLGGITPWLLTGFIMWWGRRRALRLCTTKYSLTTRKNLPNGRLTIVQVSDVHPRACAAMDHTRIPELKAKIEACRPDLLVLTGDIFDEFTEPEELDDVPPFDGGTETAVELLVRNQAVDNTISVEDVRTRMEEQYPLAVPAFEQALADSGVERNDRVTVSPSRIKKLESRSFKTESGIEIKIPAELCNSDDAVEFIHSATGGLSLLIKDVLV